MKCMYACLAFLFYLIIIFLGVCVHGQAKCMYDYEISSNNFKVYQWCKKKTEKTSGQASLWLDDTYLGPDPAKH